MQLKLTKVKVRQCKNCLKVFNFGPEDRGKVFCDQICKDEYSFNRPVPEHVCKYCSNIIKPRRNSKGQISSWRITCGEDNCPGRPKKSYRNYYTKTFKPDLEGHTCKMCATYKTWDKFHFTNGRHHYRCKECVNKKLREYYQKNKEAMQAKSKKYYWDNKKCNGRN